MGKIREAGGRGKREPQCRRRVQGQALGGREEKGRSGGKNGHWPLGPRGKGGPKEDLR